ncbi:MAG: LTA synthase family protein [Chitinophagaceae bacterium]
MSFLSRLTRSLLLLALLFLLLMTVLRIVTFTWFVSGSWDVRSYLPVFWLGFRYDARVVGILILLLLLIGSIPIMNPFKTGRGKWVWLFLAKTFAFLLVVFYTFDFFHYRYLAQRLNASALAFLEDATISATMVWQTYPVIKVLVAMVITIFLFFWLINRIYKFAADKSYNTPKTNRVISCTVLFLVCGLAIFGRAGQYPLRWSDAFNLGSDFRANLALNPFQSFLSSLSFRTTTFDREAVKKYYPYMASYLGVDHPDLNTLNYTRRVEASARGGKTRPNVIIVICESFSAYKSSMWGNPLNTTPFFNSLSKEGLFFDHCFTPHFGTARGVWATVTGIPDVEKVKTASRNPAMVDQHTIINDFKDYGKFYFLGGSTSWANIRGVLTNNIRDLNLYEEGSYDVPRIDVWGISDKNLFLQANKVLSKQQKPFIAVIQTSDNHRPYTISAEDVNEFRSQTLPEDTLHRYGFQSNEELNAFRYTDFGYQKFIEAAKTSAYFKNTIFVFVGDHGIQGDAGTMFPRAWTDQSLSSYHVPLLFYSPALIPPERVHELASQVDILPTVAGLANISYTNTTLGRDLLQSSRNDTSDMVLSSTAFVMNHSTFDIGVLRGDYYYERQTTGKKEQLLWANFNRPEPAQKPDSALLSTYRELTSAFFETARYMLLNNKKKNN